MKIGIVTPVFPPYASGIGNVAEAQALSLQQNGNPVVVITPAYDHAILTNESLKVIRIQSLVKFGNAAWIKEIPAEFDQIEILHLHYPFIGGVGAVLKFKKKNTQIPVVVTYHMDLIGRGWKKIFFKLYTGLTLSRILKVADKVIISSFDYAQTGLLKKYILANREKFIEIPFGIDLNRFGTQISEDKIREIKSKLGIKFGEQVILFVGALDKAHYFKGLTFLFKALSDVAMQDWKLVIVGGGELIEKYKKEVSVLGLVDKVIFAGKIENNNLFLFYALADFLVLPSLDRSEAYGMVLLEAMAQGTPVIASDLPGVRLLALNSGGSIFTVGNHEELKVALGLWLNNKDLKVKKGGLAKEWVKKNRLLENETKQLEAVYKLVAMQ